MTYNIISWCPLSEFQWYTPNAFMQPPKLLRKFLVQYEDGWETEIWHEVWVENPACRRVLK